MQIKCNLCGSNKITELFKLNSDKFYNSEQKQRSVYTIVKCENCGLIFVKEPVSQDELKDIYLGGYYKGGDRDG